LFIDEGTLDAKVH